MKKIALAFAVVIGFGLAGMGSARTEAASPFRLHFARGGVHIDVGHGYYRGYSSHVGRHYGGRRYGGHYDYHNTTHYDFHPGHYYRHGNHIDYAPGHYDLHRSGHYDYHRGGHYDYHRGGHGYYRHR